MKTKVSIIILNWNGGEDVQRCVESCLSQDYGSIEVIIVDNASTDGSLDRLARQYPHLRYIKNATNLGFARGMNLGIAACEGEFVVPLNQDAFLDVSFVRHLISVIENVLLLGAVSPAVFESEKLESSVEQAEIGYYLRKHMRGLVVRKAGEREYVLGPSGCCPFFSRQMLNDIALFPGQYYDENYVTGGEDIDLYIRMQLRGWRCLHVPEAIAWHVGSGSVGGKTQLIEKPFWWQRNALRNRYFTIIADLPGEVLLRIMPYILFFEIGIWPFLLFKSPRTLLALVWAWYDTIKMFPRLLKKRQLVQAKRTMDSGNLMEFFVAP